jgi:Fe-Mn family superoxide dismutase
MAYESCDLGYRYDALEPNFDAQTMYLHHDKHHVAYVNRLNAVLSEFGQNFDMQLDDLVKNVIELDVPAKVRDVVRFNAGGHYNHALFWSILTPGGRNHPSGRLLEAISGAFGSFEKFVFEFEQSAMGHLGSGWTWLAVDKNGGLFICSTLNHDAPPMVGCVGKVGQPILVLDLWEHAYYLKYNNRKADYIKAFWNVVNFDKISELYGAAIQN